MELDALNNNKRDYHYDNDDYAPPPSPRFSDLVQYRDEDGFNQAWVVASEHKYPSTLGRMTGVISYGVWFGPQSNGNFGGVLDVESDSEMSTTKDFNCKRAQIYASSHVLRELKIAGLLQACINFETNFLVRNVKGWIEKYMDNPHAEPSNWDEYKYRSEILELCSAARGMKIKLSCCLESSDNLFGLARAGYFAKRAADKLMKVPSPVVCDNPPPKKNPKIG